MNKKIIKEYIDSFLKEMDLDYVGVIAYGSQIRNTANKWSDLDIMVFRKYQETQDCGSLTINGIRIEYFIIQIDKAYCLAKKEIESNDISHLTKFATCYIVYDKKNEVEKFIEYAKKLYQTKIKPVFNEYSKFKIFSISNRLDDLTSLLNEDNFFALYYDVLERIRCLYCEIYGYMEMPLSKVQKLYTNYNYYKVYANSDVNSLPDKHFINLYLKCMKMDEKEEMIRKLNDLFSFSFGDLDFDSQNFHIQFKKDAPFRI